MKFIIFRLFIQKALKGENSGDPILDYDFDLNIYLFK